MRDDEGSAALPIVRVPAMTEQPSRPPRAALPPVTLSAVIKAWWREAQRTGKSASTYEAYAHAVRLLVAFLSRTSGSPR